MARRKDHSPEELKRLIHKAAKNIIDAKGLGGLTARSVAHKIGYAPGTIYNVYRDMDALIIDVNYETLQQLQYLLQLRLNGAKPGYDAVRALGDAYIDFAHDNESAWRTLFIETNRTSRNVRLPALYKKCLENLFQLIEDALRKNANLSAIAAGEAGRVLWAALHGITVLMLDGRLSLLGIKDPHLMVDDLLRKYLGLSNLTQA